MAASNSKVRISPPGNGTTLAETPAWRKNANDITAKLNLLEVDIESMLAVCHRMRKTCTEAKTTITELDDIFQRRAGDVRRYGAILDRTVEITDTKISSLTEQLTVAAHKLKVRDTELTDISVVVNAIAYNDPMTMLTRTGKKIPTVAYVDMAAIAKMINRGITEVGKLSVAGVLPPVDVIESHLGKSTPLWIKSKIEAWAKNMKARG